MQQTATETHLPRSLAVLGDALTAVAPPAGPFDPDGSWDHGYRVYTVVPATNGQRFTVARQGSLRLHREPAEGNRFELQVALRTNHGANTVHAVDARLVCRADRLATPQEWELSSRVIGPQREPKADTIFTETAVVRDGVIRRQGATERTAPAPGSFTSNWSLFDAIQRLPANGGKPLTFAMLEELDLLKPEQRLLYRETVDAELGGRQIALQGFDQTGRGILPYAYWRDEQHRLLIAVGGMRAYLWDATVLDQAVP